MRSSAGANPEGHATLKRARQAGYGLFSEQSLHAIRLLGCQQPTLCLYKCFGQCPDQIAQSDVVLRARLGVHALFCTAVDKALMPTLQQFPDPRLHSGRTVPSQVVGAVEGRSSTHLDLRYRQLLQHWAWLEVAEVGEKRVRARAGSCLILQHLCNA